MRDLDTKVLETDCASCRTPVLALRYRKTHYGWAGDLRGSLFLSIHWPGCLLQVLRVYQDGKEIANNQPANSPPIWNLTIPVQAGSRYLLVQDADVGMPYGGYRGQPGLRCDFA